MYKNNVILLKQQRERRAKTCFVSFKRILGFSWKRQENLSLHAGCFIYVRCDTKRWTTISKQYTNANKEETEILHWSYVVIQERHQWYWPPQIFLDCLVPESGGITGVHEKKAGKKKQDRNVKQEPHFSPLEWPRLHGKHVESSTANRVEKEPLHNCQKGGHLTK